ncbi:protein PAL OF QUIRKY [Humulus lupulus]|uniref:protein PAL OF QUIRKY n=1 Tax=Humulus lupulus TaxID=3486 RepID=UPI002B4124C7|nr:protein PAL OF QUIRKY [Humulus lupulus]
MNHTKPTTTETLKFFCSYGGKILHRPSDGQLRYVGGHNRVLTVDRSICFAELMVKLGEFCGFSPDLKCLLPNGDFETLVTIKSDEELASLLEEYVRVLSHDSTRHLKIKAVLLQRQSIKKVSPPPSVVSHSVESPFRTVKSFPKFYVPRFSSPVKFSAGRLQKGYEKMSYSGPCRVFQHQHHHYHYHHHQEVPRCYYWQ